MAALPEIEDRVAAAIYRVYEQRGSEPRSYLGGSVLGGPCERALWYAFRNASTVEHAGHLLRLFDTGHREEARVVADLKAAGMEVLERDPETGRQWHAAWLGGHVAMNADGVVRGVPEGGERWHLLEVKTHNAKSFAALKKDGVKKSKPQHVAQMQVYMGALGLERALYVAVEKDTDTIYSERLHFDRAEYERLMERAQRVVEAAQPPARCTEDPAWYECKFCDHRAVCWGQTMPRRDCRTCALSKPVTTGEDAAWHCDRWKSNVPRAALREACDDHVYMPVLVPAEIQDAGPDDAPWASYRSAGGDFINGNPAHVRTSPDNEPVPVFASSELAVTPPTMLADRAFLSVKAMGRVVPIIEDSDVPF